MQNLFYNGKINCLYPIQGTVTSYCVTISCGAFFQHTLEALAVAAGASQRPAFRMLVSNSLPGGDSAGVRVSSDGSTTTGAVGLPNATDGGVTRSPVWQRNDTLLVAMDSVSSVSEESKRRSETKMASEVARDIVWPYIKFVLCEEDMDMNSDMARLVFGHVVTCSKRTYWMTNKHHYAKAIQLRRASSTHGIKDAFIGTCIYWDDLGFYFLRDILTTSCDGV